MSKKFWVPRKNISNKIQDIKTDSRRSDNGDFLDKESYPQKTKENFLPRRLPRFLSLSLKVFLSALLVIVILLLTGFYYAKNQFSGSAQSSVESFKTAMENLRLLEFDKAREEIEDGSETLNSVSQSGTFEIFNFVEQSFGTLLGKTGGALKDFNDLSGAAIQLFSDINYVGDNLVSLILDKRGEEVIAIIERAKTNIHKIYDATERFSYRSIVPLGSDALSLKVDILKAQDFIDALEGWSKDESPHYLAVFLGNASEIRPGGGFLGSYAEVVIRKGNMEDLLVRNISDVDKDLDIKIKPPKQLMGLVGRWRAADANWFFDFPTSARKTLELMEKSEFYKERGVSFDGAIGISSKVIQEILALTGPVKLSNGLGINESNFLEEIQREVQEKQDIGSPDSKGILREITPILLEKIKETEDGKKIVLGSLIQKWLTEKDVLLYFREPEFQKFFGDMNFTGNVYQFPGKDAGDYLAIVNANVGGGKTDSYVEQKVKIQSRIGAEGRVTNHLIITRRHLGERSNYWWYQVANKNYLKVFVPEGSYLSYASGGERVKITPKANFSSGFSEDADLSAVERTLQESEEYQFMDIYKESGKKVFGTWVVTDIGEKSELTLDYYRDLPSIPGDGQRYQFVFEKQAGIVGEYTFEINAPVGFRFRENGLPVFEYSTENPEARNIFDLTLEEI